MKRINEHISFLAVLTLLCTACITGGWDECPEPPEPDNPDNLIIQLADQPALTYAEADWKNATLFVLTKGQDGKDTVVATCQLEVPQPKMLSVSALRLKLDSTYRFVVWFNLDIEDNGLPYRVKTDTVFPVFYMDITSLEGDSIKDPVAPILPTFRGFKTQTLISTAANKVEIPVIQQTNDITITVVGENVIPPGGEDEVYKFVISDTAAKYSFFDNKVLAHPEFYHVSRVTNFPDRKDSIEATMRVLKLSADSHKPELTITNENGRRVFAMPDNTSLVSLIRGAYQNKNTNPTDTFNQKVLDNHNFNIKINLDEAHGVTITVNGWDVVDPGFTLDL
ncbi:hypothetical protein AGMMS49965_09310 [Bacteroidia bacterium]|nr:hypothetical protein AGMMS49965_09310 [Bacteroidia bacterium]